MTDIDTAAIRAEYGPCMSDFWRPVWDTIHGLCDALDAVRAERDQWRDINRCTDEGPCTCNHRARTAEARCAAALALAERADHQCVCDAMIDALTGDAE